MHPGRAADQQSRRTRQSAPRIPPRLAVASVVLVIMATVFVATRVAQSGAEPPVPTADAENSAAPVATQPKATAASGATAAPEPARAPAFAVVPPELNGVQWVQNFRATHLWSAPGTDAIDLGEVAQWSYFQFRGESNGVRIKLFDPGDGFRRVGGTVWAGADDFGPSGSPPVEWFLGVGEGEQGLANAPRRVTDEWPPWVSAQVALVMDAETGATLFAKNPRRHVAMASLTKMVTAIVALERGRLDDRVTVDVDGHYMAVMMESTVMGLKPGDTVTLETLLYGLMLPSGNDAAVAIARHIAGSEERFVELMNAKVRDLGLTDTQFKNPHGLDAEGHFSSAYDQAVIARYGLRSPPFNRLAAAKIWEGDGFTIYNSNRLLWNYPGADGVKPGFTDEAGSALVSSATRDGRRVIVSVIRANSAAFDSVPLLDWAFRAFRWGA